MKYIAKDFLQGNGEYQTLTPIEAAELANLKLQEFLNDAPTVFGYTTEGGKVLRSFGSTTNYNDTHIGKLLCIKKVDKDDDTPPIVSGLYPNSGY